MYRASATMAASGRSSWKLNSMNTTKGAVAKRKAASRPASASRSRRPSPKMASVPRTRKAQITAWAVSGTMGKAK
jgi:hypothetical protein